MFFEGRLLCLREIAVEVGHHEVDDFSTGQHDASPRKCRWSQRTQGLTSTMQAGFDHRRADLEHGGGGFRINFFEIPQDQHGSIGFRKLLKGRFDECPCLAPFEGRFGRV